MAIKADGSRRRSTMSSGTTASLVTAQILELIGDGTLKAGQRLVEPELARRLGVGTVPVREALRTLAGDGVVDIVPNSGATVHKMSAREIADTLKGIVGLLKVALDELQPPDIAELLPRLSEIAADMRVEQAGGNALATLRAFAEFQLTIIHASGNAYIERVVRRVHFHYYLHQVLDYLAPTAFGPIASSHVQIIECLADGRYRKAGTIFDACVKIVCDHLDRRGNRSRKPS